MKSISIPSSVKSIVTYAFYQCSELETVSFEEKSNLTTIGECSFQQCGKLKSISIPSSVKSIGNGAFVQCSELAGSRSDPRGFAAQLAPQGAPRPPEGPPLAHFSLLL